MDIPKETLVVNPASSSVIEQGLQKFKVNEDKAVALRSYFAPFEQQANEWKEKAYGIIVSDTAQTDLMKEARTARLAVRQVRIAIGKKHEELKQDSLREGQLLDFIKRTLTGLIEPIEEHLQLQEDFTQIQEKKAKEELYAIRIKQIEPYRTPGDKFDELPFGEMAHSAFETFLSGLKAAQEQRELEKAEAERVKREQEEAAIKEREKIKKESHRREHLHSAGFSWDGNYYFVGESKRLDMLTIMMLSDEEFNEVIQRGKAALSYMKTQEENRRMAKDEQDRRVSELASIGFKYHAESTSYYSDTLKKGVQSDKIQKMHPEEFDDLIADLRVEHLEHENAEIKKRQAAEEKLKKEREERKRLEREAAERAATEEEERRKKAAEERKAKRAPDKVKLLTLADKFDSVDVNIQLKDPDAEHLLANIAALKLKLVKYIRDHANEL